MTMSIASYIVQSSPINEGVEKLIGARNYAKLDGTWLNEKNSHLLLILEMPA